MSPRVVPLRERNLPNLLLSLDTVSRLIDFIYLRVSLCRSTSSQNTTPSSPTPIPLRVTSFLPSFLLLLLLFFHRLGDPVFRKTLLFLPSFERSLASPATIRVSLLSCDNFEKRGTKVFENGGGGRLAYRRRVNHGTDYVDTVHGSRGGERKGG